MASGETQAADQAATQDELDADFEAGFEGAGTGTTETPPANTSDLEDSAGAAAATTTTEVKDPAAATETPPAPGPKKVEVDEAELQALRERAAQAGTNQEQLAAINKRFDQVFGQVGSLKQVIDKLRTETPAGEAIEISEADFKDLTDAYPEIGKLTAQGLNKVLAKVKGTGGADPAAIDKMVSERVQAARGEIVGEVTNQVTDAVLNGIVPRWREQVKSPAFDTWLKAQKTEVQALAESSDLGDAAEMLRRYRRYTERPAPAATPAPTPAAQGQQQRVTTRQRQIAAAVPAKGDGAATPPARGDDDDFDAGFKAGKV